MRRGYEAEEALYTTEARRDFCKKGVLLMRTKTIKAGNYLECEIYPVVDMETAGRIRTGKRTTKAQKEVNLRNARKKLERLMNANFGTGDLIAHLTMEETDDEAGMRRIARNFIGRLRARARKKGVELRYIYVLEATGAQERRRGHMHMVLNGGWISRDEIEAMWGHGLSRVDRVQRQEKGLCGFAQYITQRKETQEKLLHRRWACSKGLKQPVVLTSDHKFTRAASARIAAAVGMDARAEFERRYPGYMLVEQPLVRYSELAPGAYIYAFMRKKEA